MVQKLSSILGGKLNAMLSRPYPKSNSRAEILISSFLFAVTVYFFLIVFQPFGTYNFYSPHKYVLLTPYALICFFIISATNFYLKKPPHTWSIARELLKMLFIMAFCSVLNYIYLIEVINKTSFSLYGLMYMLLYTFAIGIPVTLVYFLGRYIYLENNGRTQADSVAKKPAASEVNVIIIKSDVSNISLQLLPTEFLFAESAGNYCTIYYLNNNIPKKQLLRLSLKTLEEQINEETILRCHRSFIVNTRRIRTINGNAQGYKLQVDFSETVIPVSRKYIAVINKM